MILTPKSDQIKIVCNDIEFIQEKTFPFQHDLKRQSSIISHNEKMYIFCKGAPEIIFDLCSDKNESRIDIVTNLSKKGLRIIAMGYREIEKTEFFNRELLEKDLKYLGLMVFSNDLKAETTKIITELEQAKIPTAMITGDNLDTALAVGKECRILNENPIFTPV